MSVIVPKLNELANVRLAVNDLTAKIEALAPELVALRNEFEKQAAALEVDIKRRAKYIPQSKAHTLAGKFLQLIHVKPQPVYSNEQIVALLDDFNNLASAVGCDKRWWLEDLLVERTPFWRIGEKKGGK